MSDWFANVNQLYNIVQKQSAIIQTLQDRVAVLENHCKIATHVPATTESEKAAKDVKGAKSAKGTKAAKAKVAKGAKIQIDEIKKRGRKPTTDIQLSEFLREGEQVIARIPLGNRQFDEHAVTFQDGQLVLEDGQTFEHPTTLVGVLAKMLEDIGERSTECSKSLNGWLLCTVSRGGKRVPLEKIKDSKIGAQEETAEEATEEAIEEATE